MRGKAKASVVGLALIGFLALGWLEATARPAKPLTRDEALKAYQAGNYKDAYEALRPIVLDPKQPTANTTSDLNTAINSLANLGRVDEIDEFRESVATVHKDNWRVLEAVAQSYAHTEHYGYIVAGQFSRGHKRGGGRYVWTWPRDRGRALQLMQQALDLTKKEADKPALARFHLRFANFILNGEGGHEAWRLQYLTDLAQLPDYEDGYRNYYGDQRGAAVDGDGKPVYHLTPKSYETATSDGERWRWMLAQAVEFDPSLAGEADMMFARFLHGQFSVQTLARHGYHFGANDDDDTKKDESGTFALHTLKDEETIARLANGVKRLTVPDEFNWIKVCERIAGRGQSGYGDQARTMLAQGYEDRRQYVKAAAAWKKGIEEYGSGSGKQDRLDQIVGNWGRFETGRPQPAGAKAVVDFRFRNGKKVSFEAQTINVSKLLEDVKGYLRSNPARLEWNKLNVSNIGYRLVEENEKQYLIDRAASWDVDLKPRPAHVDDRITITTPLTKPGAYLLTAKMADGNTSRIIVWLSDTVILKKPLEGKAYYYVADAVTGAPVDGATLDFFGYKQVPTDNTYTKYRVDTSFFVETTDDDGQLIVGKNKVFPDQNWLVTARKEKAGVGGADRFAYLGFSHVWYGNRYDPEYNATKAFFISDRPVYRPAQTVKFKAWIAHAKYDQGDASEFAGRNYTVEVHNPKGEKVYSKSLTADDYGGLEGEYLVPSGATLGTYGVQVAHVGHGSFRVEEYKKPEYEVTVDAPKEPVKLGEMVTATIKANYYFGAPVTSAVVKYKVTRTSYSKSWYPRGDWDWFYGSGYWWFAGDYVWYPGWGEWGCKRPYPIWWWGRHHEQPEVVVENEMPIGPDGTVKILLDTAPAKALHGDQDHQYVVTAEVRDESRRTIVGTGNILVSRKPFKVFSWVNKGHYRAGDTVEASFRAQTLDGQPVKGTGELTLYRISYDDKNQPVETKVEGWKLDTDDEGQARQQMKAATAGQFRLSYKVTDTKKHTIEGGYLFVVRGEGFDGKGYRFNDLELVTDKREYAPGEKVKLLVNTNREKGTVLLFPRPTNGVYLEPKVIRLKGKSAEEEIAVAQRDMPNFFVEAVTIHDGGVFTETREIVVPPEKRVLNVQVLPSQAEYKPGQKATMKVKVTDAAGKPFVGSTVLSVYDKSVEYISGGSNVPEIKEFFWKWRRHHHPGVESSLAHWLSNLVKSSERGMSNLGIFGETVVEELQDAEGNARRGDEKPRAEAPGAPGKNGGSGGPGGAKDGKGDNAGAPADGKEKESGEGKQGGNAPAGPEPTVRQNFADTAYWSGALVTDKDGIAEATFNMPENLTGWKVKAWVLGAGTRVGQGETVVTTKKDLLVRLQAPRFFVERDEVVLSANVHNYLKDDKTVAVTLEVDGGTLAISGSPKIDVKIPAGGEKRVDWRVTVKAEGEAVVRMKAVTDADSDAMQMRFPCFVHGMLKTDSFSGVVRPDQETGSVTFNVPKERRINETRLEVRYSPTLAGAMVDALPYMVEYPYGCTEQTLNRFLPTVITQKILQEMKLDLKEIEKKRTNLNAQEIGDDKERARGWKRFDRNPVFDEAEVKRISEAGLNRLVNMQVSDGGWGWFSGAGEMSYAHTTAVVVHGLQLAKENGLTLPAGVLERGVAWLKVYRDDQVRRLQNAAGKVNPWKEHADNLDALVHMVLADANDFDANMRDLLYRDRTKLSVYAKAMFGLALYAEKQADMLAMIHKNIEQFVVVDDENQTAYLKLPGDNPWWYWYGSEIEADAYYLKLLARTKPKDPRAAGLVKYLLNNRKHSTYWNSTRDTAVCIEAMAEYMKASGEDKPDMTVEVWLDGKKQKEVKITPSELFTFDNKFVLLGDAVESGAHKLEIKKKGTGPVYFNAYVSNFTLEDDIKRAGLEVKVNRKVYKLNKVDKTIKVPGARGQAADQRVEKYERKELTNLSELKSGDLVEVELEIDSKNDYEYLLFEDFKAAGFEPVQVRSGYGGNDMGAYMELRDDRVSFFVRHLARGKHSVSYRLRAEIPGKFSALPARASAMYAPELQGNSDEIKLVIKD